MKSRDNHYSTIILVSGIKFKLYQALYMISHVKAYIPFKFLNMRYTPLSNTNTFNGNFKNI